MNKIPDELVEISSHITEMLRKDDCFNVVLEEDSLEIVMCLQDFGELYERQKGEPFITRFTTEMLRFAENDKSISWSIKCAPPNFILGSIASDKDSLLIEAAQMMLMWASEVDTSDDTIVDEGSENASE